MFFYKQLSKSLCFNFMHYVQKKNNLFLAQLPRISANWNEKYRPYSFQTLANISGNFRKIYNPRVYTATECFHRYIAFAQAYTYDLDL